MKKLKTTILLTLLVLFLFPATPSKTFIFPIHGDGTLTLFNTHLAENLTIQFRNENGTYNRQALKDISHLLRCRLTEEEHVINPQLLDTIDNIQDHFGGKTIYVVSGYRSPVLNQDLRKKKRGVAKNSLHMHGMAMDIQIPGIPTSQIRDYAISLQIGGVGYYRSNAFVHVDVGRIRNW